MKPLLLLHGAIGASAQLAPLAEQLSANYKVYTINFTGHGGKPFGTVPFSMELFANDVLAFMDEEGLDKISIFGFSMGGYVGVYFASLYPEKVEKVVTLGTKYYWDEAVAAKETQMLNPEKIEQKVPNFAAALERMHAPNDWKEVLRKTGAMMTRLGKDSTLKPGMYPGIATPVLVLLGDRDKMVTLDETVATYKALHNAQMGMLPNTPHPVEMVEPGLLAQFIKRFLA